MLITLSHEELSLLLFALEGAKSPTDSAPPKADSCEEGCPIIENIEETLCGHLLPRETQLARHLNNHMREAMIECGVFELMGTMAGAERALTSEEQSRLQNANVKLSMWNCQINLDEADFRLLLERLSKLPLSAWIVMPRALWRLKKKLKSSRQSVSSTSVS